MENSYGVGVQNRYELFCDEDADPFDMIKAKKPLMVIKDEEKENKAAKTKPAAAKKTVKVETKAVEKSPVQGKPRWLVAISAKPNHAFVDNTCAMKQVVKQPRGC